MGILSIGGVEAGEGGGEALRVGDHLGVWWLRERRSGDVWRGMQSDAPAPHPPPT
jgi:hypothetical protein